MGQILRATYLSALIFPLLSVSESLAGEGEGHSHAPGGDWKVIGGIIVFLVVVGVTFNLWGKKNK
jgi:hypothetical protein